MKAELRWRRFPLLALSGGLMLFLGLGCRSNAFEPMPVGEVGFLERAQVQRDGDITVRTAVPSRDETRRLFSTDLYGRGVQPVWIEVLNGSDETVSFLPVGLDPDYFTPIETAFLRSRDDAELARRVDRYFFDSGLDPYVAAGAKRSGFVFTTVDEGTKSFNVDILGEANGASFTFFVEVPGLKIDHYSIDFEAIYAEDEVVDLAVGDLIEALEALPCCTSDKKAKGTGDPLNIVVIGHPDEVYYAFLRAGWDETETIHRGSLLKTAASFLSGGEYRYSPVSSLYVFGRPQEVAFQKARSNIHERNHLRLWMAPMRYQGRPVWIGQISRDIGVRFTRKTITTHKIDPNVDETREYLLENLAYAQALERYAYVGGVGAAPMDEPRGNLTGDPYFTDGFRVVLWPTSRPVAIGDLQRLDWRTAPYESGEASGAE